MSFLRRLELVCLGLLLACVVGCAPEEVKIGAIISQTGDVAPYGEQVRRGLDLALEEVNAAGGFDGATIQLLYRDDASLASGGEAAAKELIEEQGVGLIIGAISSAVTLSIAPICQKEEVLLLSPTSSAPALTEAGDYIMRNYPSDVLEGTAMADLARSNGVRRVVIFAADNEYGRGLEDVFTKGFVSSSRKIVASYRLLDDTATLAPMIEELQQLKPQAIYIVGYLNQMTPVLTQLREAGVEALVMATSSVTDRFLQSSGELVEDMVFPRPSFEVNSKKPEVASFVTAFRAKYDMDPDIYAAHGYDALKLLYQSMLDTGRSHPDDVRRGLLGLKSFVGAAGRTGFDSRGDVVRYPQLFVVRESQAVPLEQFKEEGGKLSVPEEG